MGAKRIIWHVGFERNLRRRGPPSFEVRAEVPLSDEPPRPDYLLLRKIAVEGQTLDNTAHTLRRLWPMLPRVSVVEYKSPSRSYRAGNLDRLWGYVHTYYANQRGLPRRRADGTAIDPNAGGAPEVRVREDLCAILVVPARTPSLNEDVALMGLAWEDLGDGYWRVQGGLFTLHVVEIDVVGPAEGDDLLHSLGHGKPSTPEARWFWMEFVGSQEARMSMQDMEGFDEALDKFLSTLTPEQRVAGLPPEQRMAGLPPEQRMAGLPPEQRMAGLPPEEVLAGFDRDHQALALPLEVLRLLPESYLRSLSPDVEVELRRRLARPGG